MTAPLSHCGDTVIYERRYDGKRPYGKWERIDRETYEWNYRRMFPKARTIPDTFGLCVYEYRRRTVAAISKA